MRKIFVAFAAALLVSVGNAVSLRQFQARDANALATAEDNNFQRPAPREDQENDEQRPPKEGRKRAQNRPRRPEEQPPAEGEENKERPPRENEEEQRPAEDNVETFSQRKERGRAQRVVKKRAQNIEGSDSTNQQTSS